MTVADGIFHPLSFITASRGVPLGREAVNVLDSPGVSSIQSSDQMTGAISPPDGVRTTKRNWKASAVEVFFK